MSRRVRTLLITAIAVLAVAAPATADARNLRGIVGPGFTITLNDENGNRIGQLEPGTHTIVVEDRSADHNFHLRGPGVDQATSVEFVGTVTWTVTVTDGTYVYVCDPHASSMRGTFTVGQTTPPPAVPQRLIATVGPRNTISLRTTSGARVRHLKAGNYRITVRDRSARLNFRLRGLSVNRATGKRFRGTVVWLVSLRAGTTYRYSADGTRLRGSFTTAH